MTLLNGEFLREKKKKKKKKKKVNESNFDSCLPWKFLSRPDCFYCKKVFISIFQFLHIPLANVVATMLVVRARCPMNRMMTLMMILIFWHLTSQPRQVGYSLFQKTEAWNLKKKTKKKKNKKKNKKKQQKNRLSVLEMYCGIELLTKEVFSLGRMECSIE